MTQANQPFAVLLFIIGLALDGFKETVTAVIRDTSTHTMLAPGIFEAYVKGANTLQARDQVRAPIIQTSAKPVFMPPPLKHLFKTHR